MNKKLTSAALKFLITGGISTGFNYLIFYLLVRNNLLNYLPASVTGYLGGLILGFFLNHLWTFENKEFEIRRIFGYLMVYMFALAVSTGLLWLFVDKYHFNKYYMNFVAIGISTIINFVGLNTLIYKSK